MNDIKLFEHKLGKNGKLAILRVENFVGGIGHKAAMDALDEATFKYCGNTPCCMFTDITLMNPYERMIIRGISELPLVTYGVYLRREKLKKINEIGNENR